MGGRAERMGGVQGVEWDVDQGRRRRRGGGSIWGSPMPSPSRNSIVDRRCQGLYAIKLSLLSCLSSAQMFGWLIGDTEVWATDVVGPDGKIREQSSVLHIKKCRFLEQVGGSGNGADLAKCAKHHYNDRGRQGGAPTLPSCRFRLRKLVWCRCTSSFYFLLHHLVWCCCPCRAAV